MALGLCVAVAATRGTAQTYGAWEPGFNHGSSLTPGAGDNAGRVFTHPTAPPAWPVTFNSVHMCLIPAGPHRGKVLVWDTEPSLGAADPFAPGTFWSFQRYSIIDPRTAPPTFLNFFLPIEPLPPGTTSTVDLFCSGHAWSPFGFLLVAGGTRFTQQGVTPAPIGADRLWTFDPRQPGAAFPGSTLPFYGGTGEWKPVSFQLREGRFYPTVTLTQALPRPPLPPQHIMLVLGGSTNPGQVSPPMNDYEAVRIAWTPTGGASVTRDVVNNVDLWWGPGDPSAANPFQAWLLEYPRSHLLSNGLVMVSGYAPRSAMLDHSFLPGTSQPLATSSPWQQKWLLTAGNTGPASVLRDGGASLLYPRDPGLPQWLVRIGGDTDNGQPTPQTDSSEVCEPTSNGNWVPGPAMGAGFERDHLNAVVLPDRSVLVIGGENSAGPVMQTQLFVEGTGIWIGQAQPASTRDYHSCAVLLPDGRVFTGGGEGRHVGGGGFDYEIFNPHYLTGNPPAPRPEGVEITNPSGVDLEPFGNEVIETIVLNRTGSFFATAGLALGAKLKRIVLVAPGSTTHHSDMHARHVECATTFISTSTLQFQVPGETIAPDGYYMLFALTGAGIPSEALWVRLSP